MTRVAALLSRADRKRLLKRLAEDGDLDRLMRERGTLPPAPEPMPPHRAGHATTTERTTTS
jgi:hypothetical protein